MIASLAFLAYCYSGFAGEFNFLGNQTAKSMAVEVFWLSTFFAIGRAAYNYT